MGVHTIDSHVVTESIFFSRIKVFLGNLAQEAPRVIRPVSFPQGFYDCQKGTELSNFSRVPLCVKVSDRAWRRLPVVAIDPLGETTPTQPVALHPAASFWEGNLTSRPDHCLPPLLSSVPAWKSSCLHRSVFVPPLRTFSSRNRRQIHQRLIRCEHIFPTTSGATSVGVYVCVCVSRSPPVTENDDCRHSQQSNNSNVKLSL